MYSETGQETRRTPVPNPRNGSETELVPIRIMLGDERSVFRDSLQAWLMTQPDLQVVADTSEPGSILSRALALRPDVILFDPVSTRSVLPVLRQLQESGLAARVVLMVGEEDAETLSEAILCGVAALIEKNTRSSRLLSTIRRANAGELCLDQLGAETSVRQLIRRPALASQPVPHGAFSTREREISGLVTQGYRNREIADKLTISEQTVKNHLHNIFEKTGIRDRLELALYSIYHGLY